MSAPEEATGCGTDSPAMDVAAIFRSVGEVPYDWHLASDRLSWGENVRDVIPIDGAIEIDTGRGFGRILASDNMQTRYDAVMHSTRRDDGAGVPYQVQYALCPSACGGTLWVEDAGRWFAGPDGRPARAHGMVRVINERHAQEERLAYLSRFDGLTGEMNRWHLTDMLSATLDDAVRFRASCGFLIVAIDNLSRINDSYGFDVSDEVITAVAKRLRSKMRGGDTLGRFSGNKFGVILKKCTTDDIAIAAERLLSGVRDDVVQTKVGPVAVSATIGGVVAPRHAQNLHDVTARAQEALHAAKLKRTGSFQAYQPNVERDAMRRENIRAGGEIVDALNARRILIAYEPVVDAHSRAPAFYECLMRMRRPDDAVALAGDVIPIAERLGLVRLIDHRMLELTIAEMARAPQLRCSLNLSAATSVDPEWWTSLTNFLRARPGVAERLTVEITESVAIQNVDDTRGFVARVKDLGARIAIDDFGAGYTSFRTLRKLGVDMIKIDGAFVQNLTRSEDDRAFVHTLIDLALRLKLETVAEWVQDEEAAALLASWGCNYLQGALIGLADIAQPWLRHAPDKQAADA